MKRLLFLLFMLAGLFSHAQISQELRREFADSEGLDDLSMALFGRRGLIAFGEESLKGSGGRRFAFIKLDPALKTVGKATVDLPKQYKIRDYKVRGNELVVFFQPTKGDVWRLTTVSFKDMKATHFNGNLKRRTVFNYMDVCGDYAYVGSMIKRKVNLLIINRQNGRTQKVNLESQHGKRPWLVNIESDTASGHTFVYVGYYIKGNHTGIDVHVYNSEGEKIETYVLSGVKDHNLTKISATCLGPDHYAFVGTYSRFSARQGEGFFVAEMKDGERTFLKYHNYLDLEGFTSYMTSGKQARIEKKKERRDARGKEFSLNTLMVPHQMILCNGRYYFLGEFFYETYINTTTTRMVNGQMQTTTTKIFDGYQYTHSVVASFDQEGDLLWNSSFEMWFDFKPMRVYKFVTFSVSPEDRVDLMFTSRGSVFYKSLDADGQVINDRSFSGIETGSENDKLVRSISMMEYWYDNKFLAYGFQSIKDMGKSIGKKKRRVMFINVIDVE